MGHIIPIGVHIRRLRPSAVVPQYQTVGSAGMDLAWDGSTPTCSEGKMIGEMFQMAPISQVIFPTGISIALPSGYEATVRSRSGLSARGLTAILGTIDEDYRGEIRVLLCNSNPFHRLVSPGDRIAQLVVSPVARVAWTEVDALPETARGDGGFGSTGTR